MTTGTRNPTFFMVGVYKKQVFNRLKEIINNIMQGEKRRRAIFNCCGNEIRKFRVTGLFLEIWKTKGEINEGVRVIGDSLGYQ